MRCRVPTQYGVAQYYNSQIFCYTLLVTTNTTVVINPHLFKDAVKLDPV
jgi:hypothetical protein